MEYLQHIILGLIQGLTEFLPVSSSGHLVLFENVLGMTTPDGFLLESLLHIGTLAAVFIVFWKDIYAILREIVLFIPRLIRKESVKTPDGRMIILILITLIPLFICAALGVQDYLDILKKYPILVGIALLVTGCVLLASDNVKKGKKDVEKATLLDAVLVGLSQVAALTPGLSRSGLTITAGLFRGFDRKFAFKFSFLMGIPAILGATVLELKDALSANAAAGAQGLSLPSLLPVFVGMIVAAVSGYFAIRLLQYIMKKNKFAWFAYYCFGAGLITILFSVI